MGYAKYVGRVGGLAVALGVGVAVATTPGVAWAGPSDSGSSSSSLDSSTSSSPKGESSSGAAGSSAESESSGESGGEDAGSGAEGSDSRAAEDASSGSDDSGGSKKSTGSTVKDKKSGSDFSAAGTTPKTPKRSVVRTPSDSTDVSTSEPASDTNAAVQPKSEPVSPPQATNAVSVVEVASVSTLTTKTSLDQPRVVSEPESVDTPLASTLLSAVGLAPSADGDVPEVPGDSPLLLAGLAAFRRQTQQSLVGDESSTLKVADPSQSSLMVADTSGGESMMMAAVAANSAPVVSVQPTGIPHPVSGVVSGQVVASDGDGNPLSYSVTGTSASGGKVTINSTTGAYTYTPTAAQRLAAGTTSAADVDTFTVSVFDGQTTTTGTVPVYVSPTQLNLGTPIAVQRDPAGVAVYQNTQNPTQNRTYVINQYDKTVSVIDTNPNSATYNKVVGTITLASSPTDIVLNSTGTLGYVSMKGNASVAVIDTQAKTVIKNVLVGSTPTGIAISPDNSRVYVTNGGSSTVSVIDTALNQEISRITVGSQPNGVAVSPDGKRLYVTLRSTDSLAVVNLADNSKTMITVGDSPREVALTPDGKRAYVTNYDATVSVINTDPTAGAAYNTQIAKINTGAVKLQPVGVAISPDGALAYVANGKDTVSVISTKTNTIVQTLTIDSVTESGAHSVALSPDGTRIYVTDLRDDNVRVLSLTRGNTAPLAIANPTVDAANPSNGAVSGLVNIKDPDGDALTYSTAVSPTKGSVTFNPATGTYTYTPTQAARDAAAQTPATDTFTIRATDPNGAYKDTTPITVTILPSGANHAPVLQGAPTYVVDLNTGRVSGSFRVTDVDGDLLSYSYTEPAGGDVMVFGSSGPATSYTYDFIVYMSEEAREQAAQTVGPDTYTFTVTLSDGRTWTHVPVSVPIEPRPTDMPVWQGPTTTTYDPYTGGTTGNMNVFDPDGDPLTYGTTYGPWYGTLTIDQATGNYVYVPYLNADQGVSSYEIVTVSVNDGTYVTYHDWWVQTYRDDLAPM